MSDTTTKTAESAQGTPEVEALQITDRRAGAVLEQPPAATQALATIPTPAELVHLALTRGADPAILERLMDLQLRWETQEARKAYTRAMAAFKANPPSIYKDKHVDQGPGRPEYDHATLGNEVRAITAAAAVHGLSAAWDVDQAKAVEVACIVTHRLGHSERVSITAAPDKGAGRNDIQAVASTITYLRRYTLECAFGVASEDGSDDDGRAADSATSGATKRKPKEKKEETRAEHAARVFRHYGVLLGDIEQKLGTVADDWGEEEWEQVNSWRSELKTAPRESWPELARKLFDLEPGASG